MKDNYQFNVVKDMCQFNVVEDNYQFNVMKDKYQFTVMKDNTCKACPRKTRPRSSIFESQKTWRILNAGSIEMLW